LPGLAGFVRPTATSGNRTRLRHASIVDMLWDPRPTAEQPSAELRRRPLGSVLADIRRALGIQPGDPTQARWAEIHHLILTGRSFGDAVRRIQSPPATAARSRARQAETGSADKVAPAPPERLLHLATASGAGSLMQPSQRRLTPLS